MYLLSGDEVIYISKFLYPRDMISFRLVCKWLSISLCIRKKVDDETTNITHSTQNIARRKRCYACGLLFFDSLDMELHYICECKLFRKNYDMKLNYIPKMNWISEPYTLSMGYVLLSHNDIECTKSNCSCQSKKEFTQKILSNYCRLETDYGIIMFDIRNYVRKKIIFTDCIVYKPIVWDGKSDRSPKILQTPEHLWVILNYTHKIIPIRKVTAIYL